MIERNYLRWTCAKGVWCPMKGATWVMLTWSAMLLGISSIWVISIYSIWVISISSIVISTLLCYIYPHMTIIISAFDPHISMIWPPMIISRSWHLLCLALCSVLPPLVARRPGEAEKEVSGAFSLAFAGRLGPDGEPEVLFHSEPEAPLLLNGTLMTNLRANLPENFFLTRESCPYPPLLTPLER